MNKTLSICATAALGAFGASAQAQEVSARVISSTPITQQVQVPRQVCSNQPMVVQQPRSGAGMALGAIAGGAAGNAIGGGSGRAAATVLGLVGGAVLGDRIEGGGSTVQNVQHCTTQTFYENRTVAYNVTYEYNGREYTVQTQQDPGPYIRLQLTPVGSVNEPPQDYAQPAPVQPLADAPPAYIPSQPAVVAGALPSVIVPPTVAYPAYYPAYAPAYYPSYYPPVGLSFNFGYSSGWSGHRSHRHGGHRGHRR